jgi:hypothetical protein
LLAQKSDGAQTERQQQQRPAIIVVGSNRSERTLSKPTYFTIEAQTGERNGRPLM